MIKFGEPVRLPVLPQPPTALVEALRAQQHKAAADVVALEQIIHTHNAQHAFRPFSR